MGCRPLAIPHQVQAFRSGVLRTVAPNCPLAGHARMQNRNGRVGKPQGRQLSHSVVVKHVSGPIDFRVLNWSTTHDDVRLDDVVSEDHTQFLVAFYRPLDVVQVLILLVVTDVPAERELPIPRAQMMQGVESTRQEILRSSLKSATRRLSGKGPSGQISPNSLNNTFADRNTGPAAAVSVVWDPRVTQPQDILGDSLVECSSQSAYLSVAHAISPITCSSCMRCSICDLAPLPHRAGIMRLSRSRRRTPM